MLPDYIKRTSENTKILEPSISIIRSFDQIIINPEDEEIKSLITRCELRREGNRHQVLLVEPKGELRNDRSRKFKRLPAHTNSGEIILRDLSWHGFTEITFSDLNPNDSKIDNFASIYSIDSINSKNFQKKPEHYYRLFVPINQSLEIQNLLKNSYYILGNSSKVSYECIAFNVNNIPYYFYNYQEKNNQYIIIESMQKENYDSFSNNCFSVLLSYGFISGDVHLDKFYYFTYKELEKDTPHSYTFVNAVRSIHTYLSPIYLTRNMIPYSDKTAIRIQSNLKRLTSKQFSALCTSLAKSLAMQVIILMITEAGELSLNLRPAAYAIVLEALTDFIVEEMKILEESNHKDISVITVLRKETAKEIKNRFKNIINSEFKNSVNANGNLKLFNERLDGSIVDGYEFIINKINDINQPTNQDKLTKPFSVMGVTLNDEDKELIKYRNKLLHGESPDFYGNSLKEINDRIFYITYRFYTLVSALILARVSFPYVLEYSVIYKKEHRQPTKGNIIRKLSKPLYSIT